jgi:hypothetical protein
MGFVIRQFNAPTGNVLPVRQKNGDFTAPYSVTAQFAATDDDVCGTLEFRQYIKGSLIAGGTPLKQPLCARDNVYLSPTDFHEDGCAPPGPFNLPNYPAYGYRVNGTMLSEGYYDSSDASPPQDPAGGCFYEMLDAPGFGAPVVLPPYGYRIDLAFFCQLVDSVSGAILQTGNWTVQGSLSRHSIMKQRSTLGIRADDLIKNIVLSRNLITGTAEAQLVIVRRKTDTSLDSRSFQLVLRDADGSMLSITEPRVYETLGRCSNTTFVVYTLAPDAPHAVKAEVIVEGATSVLEVLNELQ